jgi:hypothetical protein
VTLALGLSALPVGLHLSRPEAGPRGWIWLLLIPIGFATSAKWSPDQGAVLILINVENGAARETRPRPALARRPQKGGFFTANKPYGGIAADSHNWPAIVAE